MRERSVLLASVTFVFFVIAGLAAKPTHAAATDDCLSRPNSPAPQGHHWYYRIDHANNRQCWRLGPEGLRVQKSESKIEAVPAPVARPAAPPQAQRPETTGAVAARAEVTPDPTPKAEVASPPRPASPTMPDLPASEQPAPQPAVEGTQTASALDIAPLAENSAPASASEPTAADPTEEPSRPATASTAAATGEIDHTFAILMIVFAVLAVAGPTLHFAERRRQRVIVTEEPPQWARVVTLNTPTPRVHVPPMSEPSILKWPPPIPPTPVEQTERLAQALQQLVDRLHSETGPEPGLTPPVQRSNVEVMPKRSIAARN